MNTEQLILNAVVAEMCEVTNSLLNIQDMEMFKFYRGKYEGCREALHNISEIIGVDFINGMILTGLEDYRHKHDGDCIKNLNLKGGI